MSNYYQILVRIFGNVNVLFRLIFVVAMQLISICFCRLFKITFVNLQKSINKKNMYIDPEKYLIKSERINGKIVHTKHCMYCNATFESKRMHTLTCSKGCQTAHYRRIKKGMSPLNMPKKK